MADRDRHERPRDPRGGTVHEERSLDPCGMGVRDVGALVVVEAGLGAADPFGRTRRALRDADPEIAEFAAVAAAVSHARRSFEGLLLGLNGDGCGRRQPRRR